jgi:hypothetical protein
MLYTWQARKALKIVIGAAEKAERINGALCPRIFRIPWRLTNS